MYYQIGLNLPVTEYSDNFFSNTDHLEMPNFTNDNFRDGIGYRELESEKIILEIIGLFIELEQASICKGLIRILPESVTKNYYVIE